MLQVKVHIVQFMVPITHGEQSADGWKNTGSEKPTNGDEEIAMTRAESIKFSFLKVAIL